MAFMYGYGLMTDDRWATVDNIFALLEAAPAYKAEVMPDIQLWLDDEGIKDIRKDIDPRTAVNELLSILQDETGEEGIHVVLARVIDEVEGIELVATSYDESFPFLVLDIRAPWNLPCKVKNLTQAQMDQTFRKYISMLTDEEVELGFYFI